MNKHITVLGTCIFLLLSEFTIYAKMFYNPFDNVEVNRKMATYTIQLMSPLVSSVDFSSNDFNDHFIFPKQQSIIVSQWGLYKEISHKGIIEYALTGGKVSNYKISELINNSVYPQNFYTNSQNTISYPTDDLYHNYFFTFKEPIELHKLFELLVPFMNSEAFGKREAGINWIPIKSSENNNEVTIGLRGSISYTLAYDTADEYDPQSSFVQRKVDEQIYYLKKSLRYLIKYQKYTDSFLNCGLFTDVTKLNCMERLDYIDRHGCFALGIVILGNNDLLNQFLPSDFRLVKVL